MTTADTFAALHQPRKPLVLFNIWDAGSAAAVAQAGAKALATGSLSMAGAQGYADGEALPFDALLAGICRITEVSSLPLSVDVETGYAADLPALCTNATALREAGVVGCNLEDRLIGRDELRPAERQAERIATVAEAGLFINARTDLFLAPLLAGEDPNRADLVEEALVRAGVYHRAGAGCLFVPGLSDPELIRELCAASPLPVNVMRLDGMVNNAELAALGVARISYGPAPWREAMAEVEAAARAAIGGTDCGTS